MSTVRSDIATVGFLLFFLLIFAFCSNSCSEDPLRDPFEYTKSDFEAKAGDNGDRILSVCDENCDLEFVFSQNKGYPEKIRGNVEGGQICFEILDSAFLCAE